MTKLSDAQWKTLTTLEFNGGMMNGWSGQRRFYTISLPALKRLGMIERVECPCGPTCSATEGYTCPADGTIYYDRVRITEAGREAARCRPA